MIGTFGYVTCENGDDDDECLPALSDDLAAGDIVEVATRYGKPALAKSDNYDDKAHLRILGMAQGDRMVYILLVTGADVQILSNTRVNARMAHDYGIEERFIGEEAITVSDLHVRSVVKRQRGRWCGKCDEYNEEVRVDHSEAYHCRACRENPWR